jgi:IclR family acetate operon transcriptional repressor
MGISNIAKKTNLNTTTTHRIIKTLYNIGVVQQDKESRIYQLAPKILLYGKAVLDSYDFVNDAHPMLGELSNSVRETVFMGIQNQFELVYIDHVDSLDHVLRMTPQIGRRQPLHSTSLGKVLLSNMHPVQLNEYLLEKELTSLTENTITDPRQLIEELDRVKTQGYALDLEETEIGICCVAAPVWGDDHQIVAAISVSGPATRMKKKGLDTFLKDNVIATSKKISEIVIT